MRLHEELDAQPQPARRHVVHLLADAVPQVEPQVLAFAAGELQAKVVDLDDAQLPAHLPRGGTEQSGSILLLGSKGLETPEEIRIIMGCPRKQHAAC